MSTDRKVVIVVRKTRLQELKEKYCTVGQAKFYLEHLGESFEGYLDEHNRFQQTLDKIQSTLAQQARVMVLERSFLPSFQFARDDIVVVLGQDGLVANVMKYLNGQPIIGINPLPDLFDGVLLPFLPEDAVDVVNQLIVSAVKISSVSLAEVNTNLGQRLLAVNDLFIGPKSHTSARYKLAIGEHVEEQSSSGVIVSTGLGSTGWFKSILAGASGIAGQPVRKGLEKGFAWNSHFLYYSVREPFPSHVTQCEFTFGKITSQQRLTLTSKMAENGVIFSDGIESDCIEFNAGTIAHIGLSQIKGNVVVA